MARTDLHEFVCRASCRARCRRLPAACFIRAARARSARSASRSRRLLSMPTPLPITKATARIESAAIFPSRNYAYCRPVRAKPPAARLPGPPTATPSTAPCVLIRAHVSSAKRFPAFLRAAHRTCSSDITRHKALRPVAWLSLSIVQTKQSQMARRVPRQQARASDTATDEGGIAGRAPPARVPANRHRWVDGSDEVTGIDRTGLTDPGRRQGSHQTGPPLENQRERGR
jgi:hypothetical protein